MTAWRDGVESVESSMYRVITCNTNGIRAAARKGFFDWLAQKKADVVCIQEIKAKEEQLADAVFTPRATTVITTRRSDRDMQALLFTVGRSPRRSRPGLIGISSI